MNPSLPKAVRELDALDDDGWRHAASGTHGNQAHLLVLSLEFIEGGPDQDRSRRSDRVAERHGTTVDIDFVPIEIEIPLELLRNHRKGLIHLEDIDVVERHSGALEHLSGRGDRRIEHQRRAIAHIGRGHQIVF